MDSNFLLFDLIQNVQLYVSVMESKEFAGVFNGEIVLTLFLRITLLIGVLM